MGLGLVNVEEGNWSKVRRNFARINSVLLGPTTSPTWAGLTLTGLTANSLIYTPAGGALTSLGAATNGQIPIGSTGAAPVLAALTGTANQLAVTNAAGIITLSLPQDIHTGATPTFAGLTISAGGTLDASTAKVLVQDKGISAPTVESDGYIGVAKIGSDGRIYFEVEGIMYYITGTTTMPPVATGNPVGLLLVLTYT